MSKFSVGEVCEALSRSDGRWRECEIVRPDGGEYEIYVPTCLSGQRINLHHTQANTWFVHEWQLRKKRPPQQDNERAEDWFIKDLNKLLKRDTVEAVIKGGRVITKVGDKRIEAGSLWELVEKMRAENESRS